MRILVLGSNGQLGQCLNDQLSNKEYDVVYTSRDQIDIADFEGTRDKIVDISPDIIINSTAYTAVDSAEKQQEVADVVNHLAVSNLADICSKLDCWLIHVSTDYVFDGSSKVPYRENDQTSPQGVYGKTKLKGELAIQSSGCRYLIFRTAWVFSEYGSNFLKTMLHLGNERDELSVVSDQIGCPTYAQDIAKTIVFAVFSLETSELTSGLYHYCGDQPCSWYGFAKAIFKEAELLRINTPNVVHAIKTLAYPTPASRPAFSVLDCSRIKNEFGVVPSDWREGIREVLKVLNDEN